ncbi:hypothetical protein FGO68_gene10998 [Halteria grandinella]|uniref:Uncharacterized protein n=1 Tax=Halteria grandinella TaxID=5974 RepID=A0A8J8NFW9_HALGN|nr:hypothetical protein FGO68_gene10998 [Halteria grandinella]
MQVLLAFQHYVRLIERIIDFQIKQGYDKVYVGFNDSMVVKAVQNINETLAKKYEVESTVPPQLLTGSKELLTNYAYSCC